jgi:hypothetical protein
MTKRRLNILIVSLSSWYDIRLSANQINIEAYIEKGIQLGLRPEFAIFCGLHKDDPRAIAEPHLFEELWFIIKSPADLIEDTIIPFWMYFKESMAT